MLWIHNETEWGGAYRVVRIVSYTLHFDGFWSHVASLSRDRSRRLGKVCLALPRLVDRSRLRLAKSGLMWLQKPSKCSDIREKRGILLTNQQEVCTTAMGTGCAKEQKYARACVRLKIHQPERTETLRRGRCISVSASESAVEGVHSPSVSSTA
jgi:hypothetical protein